MDEIRTADTAGDSLHSLKEDLTRGFAAAVGARDFLRLSDSERAFLAHVLEDFDPEEMAGLDPDTLVLLISDFWAYGHHRDNGTQCLKRAVPLMTAGGAATPYDVIEIIQTDSPFIVETVMGELTDQAVSIRAMFHPVVTVIRDGDGNRAKDGTPHRESMMLVVIERQNAERRKNLLTGIADSLHDLRLAVHDFRRMQTLIAGEIATLERLRDDKTIRMDEGVLAESLAFLRWVDENHFVFLGARGYTYPRNEDGSYAREEPMNQLQEGFGILRDAARQVLRRTSEPAILNAQILYQLEHSEPVTVAKANIKSRVHRRVYMDYIGIKRYGADGKPSGEVRFVGLFTSEAYDRPAFEVPLVRRKALHVLREAAAMGIDGGYNEKRLKNIVETYPRDELFQMTADDLLRTARGILHLSDRPRVKLFTRPDPFDRFVSVMLYIPREIYQARMQKQAGEILAAAYLGRVSAAYPYISDSLLSCIHYIIGVTPGDHFNPDIADLEADIENITRSWPQKLEALVDAADFTGYLALPEGTDPAAINWLEWAQAFPFAYQDRFELAEAVVDIAWLAGLSQDAPVNVRAYQRMEEPETHFCFKLYTRAERAIPLSDILPVLDQMGLKTLEEYGFNIQSAALGSSWVHEFILRFPPGARTDFTDFAAEFHDLILALWYRRTESDGFNALILGGASWREIALLRSLCRYRLQSGLDPSSDVQQQALRDNPAVVEALLHLFTLKFDPTLKDSSTRNALVAAASELVEALLHQVASLEHDRVLRRLHHLIGAMLRTNYFQTHDGAPKPYISFKVASRQLADLPEPKPYREIFVWAPHVEGVHLRFGPVARGGLRWSDRREDFRTEVLGLVKAQQVKNAVIVPVGSKGGFFPKSLPRPGSSGATPDAVRNEAIRAYKTFLCGLLDLTDTIDAKGAIVSPPQVVAWDDPDPYLVVAADKGTATFSDIANGVAADYGFWLGDAFASGGSAGYDHKVMGITARGAWEAVKRHFREIGKDIQTQDFTVAGVGDMSGDVFGNGMLLSEKIKLVAAFDHRHIFLDPNPDTKVSFAERQRLFALPRSSWQDYDAGLLSQGGGIFPRSQKAIPLSAEVKALLGLTADTVTPDELMNAILKADVELLYFGGIGTYIKAPSETHLQVGDKANDALRIDGNEVRAQVIGEGANLGITQAGRIACAEAGVRLNTDAIDNSAGVDCSDHEVNIKILLGQLIAAKRLKPEARDALLAQMTDDVAGLVLKDNYDQTLALTLMEATAADDNLNAQMLMTSLEKRGRLDRKVEGLPSNAALELRRTQGRGLTRPELAVIMAYGKIVLFDDIVASNAPDDPALEPVLIDYFPKALHGYGKEIRSHRLHREIIATVLANDIVNLTGPGFAQRVTRSAGVDTSGFVLAFMAARQVFGTDDVWRAVSALDNIAPTAAQTALYRDLTAFLRRQTYWISRRFSQGATPLSARISPYAKGVTELIGLGESLLGEEKRNRIATHVQSLTAQGAPEALARQIAVLSAFHHASDMIDLSVAARKPLDKTAELYFLTGDRFGFDDLTDGAASLTGVDPWDRMATRRLIEDVLTEQKAVVKAMMSRMTVHQSPVDIIDAWESDNRALVDSLRTMIVDMESGGWSFAKLTIVNSVLREWVAKL